MITPELYIKKKIVKMVNFSLCIFESQDEESMGQTNRQIPEENTSLG